jgi:glycosyltransferase involved in cell wall biosynthesis
MSGSLMRVTLHDYVTDPSLPQKDGVNLAHENIASLLRGSADTGLSVTFHDFNRLLVDEAYARDILGAADCVISNVGPHAHYYFHLREKLGLDFRIFRDVRTAIWSSYLLQEHLCRPHLREQDVLLVASHYTHGIYEKLFPHLRSLKTLRCYPLTLSFPERLPVRPGPDPARVSPFTLGYIGRLSEDKNFPDIVELLVTLNKKQAGGFRLLACGDVHSASCDPSAIRNYLHNRLGDGDYFEYLPPRVNGQIWELYGRFDAMVFPSTSNLETLGRVLIEASYAGVPVVCGAHAAAPELMPAASLCRVSYDRQRSYSAHFDHPLGRVSIEDMVNAVTSPQLAASKCHRDYEEHPQKLLAALISSGAGLELAREELVLTPSQEAFIRSLEVSMPEALDKTAADALIVRLVPWFIALQARDSAQRQQALSELVRISAHPERSARYIEKSRGTKCDFTDVGGIDIELCHLARFYPEFSLGARR